MAQAFRNGELIEVPDDDLPPILPGPASGALDPDDTTFEEMQLWQ